MAKAHGNIEIKFDEETSKTMKEFIHAVDSFNETVSLAISAIENFSNIANGLEIAQDAAPQQGVKSELLTPHPYNEDCPCEECFNHF